MLDLKKVCDNIEYVEERLSGRSGHFPIAEVAQKAKRRKEIIREVEALKAEKNKVSAEIAQMKREGKACDDLIKKMRDEGDKIKALDDELSEVESSLKELRFSAQSALGYRHKPRYAQFRTGGQNYRSEIYGIP